MGISIISCCKEGANKIVKCDTVKMDEKEPFTQKKIENVTSLLSHSGSLGNKDTQIRGPRNSLVNDCSFNESGNSTDQKKEKTKNFIENKIKTRKNERRKSVSISMEKGPIFERHRSRSLSSNTKGICAETIKNFCKKAYKNLPNKQKENIQIKSVLKQSLQKETSIISNDETLQSNNNNLPSPKGKKQRKPIETINQPFTENQLNILRNILIGEELINEGMDDSTVNMIINTISYIRVKQGVVIFTRENSSDNIYYIIDKGKLEYTIDDETYELEKYNGIGTRALVKYSQKSCQLKAIERCYLYCLPIEKYKTIAQDYFDKQTEEKTECIKQHFFFKNIGKENIAKIIKIGEQKRFKERKVILPEDGYSSSFFFVMEGQVICTKGEMVVKRIQQNELLGEIGLFNQIESFYGYSVKEGAVLIEFKYEDFINIFGDQTIRTLVYGIFENAIKENEILSKYFQSGKNMGKLFDQFQLKFYFNDTVMTPKEKKILIPISGTIFKSKYQVKEVQTLFQKIKSDKIIPKGKIFMDSVMSDSEIEYHVLGDECVIFESTWDEIEKVIPPPKELDISITQAMNLIKNHPLFKYLPTLKIFELANSMKTKKFKLGEVIIKDGPSSEMFYIIKTGCVEITISGVVVKTLDKNHTFGDIASQVGEYSRKADFIAGGTVHCYVIEKEMYEEIVDKDNKVLQPLKKLIVLNDLTISLESLYFLKEIGCGAYGKVYLVHDKKRFYAMKTADIQEMSQKKEMSQMYINEKTIMSSIDYPFIVQLHNTFKTREYLFFLMEYVDGLSLRKYLQKKENDKLRNLNEVSFYGAILFCVLNYLQKNRIIHRDLKPDNILIQTNGYLKVIDFGVAKNLNMKDYTTTFTGTTQYISPEVILGKNYSFGVDYWGVGVILYEVFYGRVPFGFGLKEPKEIYKEITEKKVTLPSDPKNADFNSLLKMLLQKNPTKRITNFQKIKSHPFFSGYDFDSLLKMKKKPPYIPEGILKEADLNNIDIPFTHFMRNNIYSSSNELDDLLKKNADDFLSDF